MRALIVLAGLLIGSVDAVADIYWTVQGSKTGTASYFRNVKVLYFGMRDRSLQIRTNQPLGNTEKHERYTVSEQVAQKAGMSLKDFMDLLADYNNLKGKTLGISIAVSEAIPTVVEHIELDMDAKN